MLDAVSREYPDAMLFTPDPHVRGVIHDEERAGCLLQGAPFVLDVGPRVLHFPVPPGFQAYNPSLVQLGGGFLLSYRADWQHGCTVEPNGVKRQFNSRPGERFSAIVRTDASFAPVGRPRVLDACGGEQPGANVDIINTTTAGSSVGTQLIDVRLMRDGRHGELWLTYLPAADMSKGNEGLSDSCRQCCFACKRSTHVGRLRLGGDGGAWSARIAEVVPLCESVVRGRNHALFISAARPRVQVWLHPVVVVADVPPSAVVGHPTGFQPHTEVASSELRLSPTRAREGRACDHLSVSGTTSLLRVDGLRDALGSDVPAAGLLGVGHVHHGKVHKVAYFASHYMHFFYVLALEAPHYMVAHSAEFCLPHSATDRRCEVVQFVTGIEFSHDRESLILTYGVNDCESKLARLEMAQLWRLLHGRVPSARPRNRTATTQDDARS